MDDWYCLCFLLICHRPWVLLIGARTLYLQHLDVEDERLWVLLQGIQVRMTQGAVFMHLSDPTAMPLSLQGVLALGDVAEALGH